VVEVLKRWAEEFGMQTDHGIQVFVSTAGLARRVGVEESEVHALLARLQRLRIIASLYSKFLLVTNVPRLGECARLVGEHNPGSAKNK
jgi:hypothetical protein